MSSVILHELPSTLNGEWPLQFIEATMPSLSENASSKVTQGIDHGDSNTLWMARIVPPETAGVDRKTAQAFLAYELFGSAREASLTVPSLPFHGTGKTLKEAEEDLVAAIEETLDELEADLRAGMELSHHLRQALKFARLVFGLEED